MIEIFCECGHNKKAHKEVKAPIWEEWCEGEGLPKDVGLLLSCQCYSFRPDNLTTIEQEAIKRGLI